MLQCDTSLCMHEDINALGDGVQPAEVVLSWVLSRKNELIKNAYSGHDIYRVLILIMIFLRGTGLHDICRYRQLIGKRKDREQQSVQVEHDGAGYFVWFVV